MSTKLARHALVTGTNRGLGLEWVRQLMDRVDHLFATCRRPQDASALADLKRSDSERLSVVGLDVTEPAQVKEGVEQVERETGALDLLINNAGINGGGTADRFGDVTRETMLEVFDVNAVGPHLVTQAFADLLRAADTNDPAVVLNVTSQLGSITNTTGGSWHSYRVSKAALNMCTRLQAGAFDRDEVTVVSMHPGWVHTDMGGSNARLSTEDSVRGMIRVLSDLSPQDSGRFLSYEGEELPW